MPEVFLQMALAVALTERFSIMQYSGTPLNRTPLGQSKMLRGVLISEVVKYTNDVFGTEKSVLLMEVSLI